MISIRNPEFRVKFQNFIKYDFEEMVGLLAFEKFLVDNYVIVSELFLDYQNRNFLTKRKTIAVIYNIFEWLMAIRFFVVAAIDKPWIWVLFDDFSYYLGHARGLNICLGLLSITVGIYGENKKL